MCHYTMVLYQSSLMDMGGVVKDGIHYCIPIYNLGCTIPQVVDDGKQPQQQEMICGGCDFLDPFLSVAQVIY